MARQYYHFKWKGTDTVIKGYFSEDYFRTVQELQDLMNRWNRIYPDYIHSVENPNDSVDNERGEL